MLARCACGSHAGWRAMARNWRLIRIPTEGEQRRRETTRRRQFLKRQIRALANRGHGQVAEYCHQKLPHRWWGPRHSKKLSTTLDAWLLGVLNKLRELILAMTNWRGWKRRFWRRSSTSRVPKVWAN